jgi:serine/threonine-protein kinase
LPSETDPLVTGRVGTVLDEKWTLERLLGVGGMAAVYAGRHRNGARAAIKVLHADLARHKEVRERFQREGYAANKVEHRGVVKVLDDDVVADGPDAGTTYLVMELLEGESLQDRLERGVAVEERELLEMFHGVLDVLRVAHEAGVVHRDLKPENLFFAREDGGKTRIKVLDFGLARLLQGQSITTTGLVLGTPSFMSPEQAAGKIEKIDGRTDLFALAATGFRLRTGRRIHEADSPIELVTKMASAAAPPIRSITPETSAPFARVIDRALQFEREDRYESAAAMQADVARALAELDPATRETALAPPVPPAKPDPPTVELSERHLEPVPVYGLDESIRIPKRRSVLPWIALLLLAGAAVMLWKYRSPAAAWWTGLAGAASSAPSPSQSSSDARRPAAVPQAGPGKPRPTGTRPAPPPRPPASVVP